MTFDQAQQFVSLVGVPASILALVFFFFWRFGRWLGPRADGVIKNHVDFLKCSQENQTRQTETLARQSELIGKTVRALAEFTDAAESAIDLETDEAKAFLEKAREELRPG
tara:strand:+ start:183 stop:512 length:330 start_codon:yes stop_codon:yes gene_type:complete